MPGTGCAGLEQRFQPGSANTDANAVRDQSVLSIAAMVDLANGGFLVK
jgi:hypothetical protein